MPRLEHQCMGVPSTSRRHGMASRHVSQQPSTQQPAPPGRKDRARGKERQQPKTPLEEKVALLKASLDCLTPGPVAANIACTLAELLRKNPELVKRLPRNSFCRRCLAPLVPGVTSPSICHSASKRCFACGCWTPAKPKLLAVHVDSSLAAKQAAHQRNTSIEAPFEAVSEPPRTVVSAPTPHQPPPSVDITHQPLPAPRSGVESESTLGDREPGLVAWVRGAVRATTGAMSPRRKQPQKDSGETPGHSSPTEVPSPGSDSVLEVVAGSASASVEALATPARRGGKEKGRSVLAEMMGTRSAVKATKGRRATDSGQDATVQDHGHDTFVQNPEPRNTAATEPAVAQPAAPEPVVTEPAVAEPAVTEPSLTETAGTEPAVTKPAVTEPAVPEPAVTEPAVTELAVTEPAVAEPAAPEPAGPEPAGTEPAVTEPAVAELEMAEPAVNEAAVAEPTPEPATQDPSELALDDPATQDPTELALAEPATQDPAEPGSATQAAAGGSSPETSPPPAGSSQEPSTPKGQLRAKEPVAPASAPPRSTGETGRVASGSHLDGADTANTCAGTPTAQSRAKAAAAAAAATTHLATPIPEGRMTRARARRMADQLSEGESEGERGGVTPVKAPSLDVVDTPRRRRGRPKKAKGAEGAGTGAVGAVGPADTFSGGSVSGAEDGEEAHSGAASSRLIPEAAAQGGGSLESGGGAGAPMLEVIPEERTPEKQGSSSPLLRQEGGAKPAAEEGSGEVEKQEGESKDAAAAEKEHQEAEKREGQGMPAAEVELQGAEKQEGEAKSAAEEGSRAADMSEAEQGSRGQEEEAQPQSSSAKAGALADEGKAAGDVVVADVEPCRAEGDNSHTPVAKEGSFHTPGFKADRFYTPAVKAGGFSTPGAEAYGTHTPGAIADSFHTPGADLDSVHVAGAELAKDAPHGAGSAEGGGGESCIQGGASGMEVDAGRQVGEEERGEEERGEEDLGEQQMGAGDPPGDGLDGAEATIAESTVAEVTVDEVIAAEVTVAEGTVAETTVAETAVAAPVVGGAPHPEAVESASIHETVSEVPDHIAFGITNVSSENVHRGNVPSAKEEGHDSALAALESEAAALQAAEEEAGATGVIESEAAAAEAVERAEATVAAESENAIVKAAREAGATVAGESENAAAKAAADTAAALSKQLASAQAEAVKWRGQARALKAQLKHAQGRNLLLKRRLRQVERTRAAGVSQMEHGEAQEDLDALDAVDKEDTPLLIHTTDDKNANHSPSVSREVSFRQWVGNASSAVKTRRESSATGDSNEVDLWAAVHDKANGQSDPGQGGNKGQAEQGQAVKKGQSEKASSGVATGEGKQLRRKQRDQESKGDSKGDNAGTEQEGKASEGAKRRKSEELGEAGEQHRTKTTRGKKQRSSVEESVKETEGPGGLEADQPEGGSEAQSRGQRRLEQIIAAANAAVQAARGRKRAASWEEEGHGKCCDGGHMHVVWRKRGRHWMPVKIMQ